MTLDNKYGVPTVALHTHVFEKVVESVNRVHGMPRAPRAFVPQPVMGKTAEQLRAYIEGKDPISGRPVMQEVIEGLTQPIDDSGVAREKLAYAATPFVADLIDFFELLAKAGVGSGVTMISGPSKTADIEMNVVTGVHGPNVVKTYVLQ